jgi:dienelactone hydrolase
MRVLLILSCLLIGALSNPVSAVAQEKVQIPWRAGWAKQFSDEQASGALEARLFRPVGVVKAPFVVFMHHCNGLKLQELSHWAKFFTQRGVGFLMVDSFTTRNIKSACENAPPMLVRQRADDAGSALAWLATQPYVRSDRIAIMGQSQGGTSALFALHEGTPGADGFVAGLAMYPGCLRAINGKIRLAKPVLVMIGSEDTWTPASDCEALQAAQPDKSELEIIVYPGAAHVFDNPVKPKLAFGKYKVGEHPASRDKARARVADWIDKVLKQ